MNTNDTTTPATSTASAQPVRRVQPDKDAALAELGNMIRASRIADHERAPYVADCLEAGRRLAAFAWTQRHESDDALIVARLLASIYNGSEARRVRLDELRWLAWEHQRDLLAVLVGTGQDTTPDTHLRDAFHAAGGRPAVDWLHSCLDYSPPELPAHAAERVRRVLTDAARDWHRSHGTDYLDTAAKSHIEAKIAAAIKG